MTWSPLYRCLSEFISRPDLGPEMHTQTLGRLLDVSLWRLRSTRNAPGCTEAIPSSPVSCRLHSTSEIMVALYLPSPATNLTMLTANPRTPKPSHWGPHHHPSLFIPACTFRTQQAQSYCSSSVKTPCFFFAFWNPNLLHWLSQVPTTLTVCSVVLPPVPLLSWSSFTLYPILLGPSAIKVLEHITHRKGSNSKATQNNRNEY